ncbi:MAG: hypothetical protein ABH872_05625 [Candidatus Omnitrophota bacterium]
MQRIIIIFLIAITVLLSVIIFQNQRNPKHDFIQPSPQIGRYQLFQGKFTALSDIKGVTRSDEDESLFLLDTTTGEVLRYNVYVMDGNFIGKWEPTIFHHKT